MAYKIADLVKQMATTSGLSDFTLAASAVANFDSFDSFMSVGDTTFYRAKNATEHEVGLGTLASGGVLQRTSVLHSSNANAKVNFSAAPELICTVPAKELSRAAAFSAYMGTNQSFTGSSSLFQLLQYDTVEWDPDGCFDNSAGHYRFVAQEAGIHRFIATAFINGGIASAAIGLAFGKNGTVVRRGIQASANLYSVSTTADIQLAAGDYVDARLITVNSLTILAGSTTAFFQGNLIRRL